MRFTLPIGVHGPYALVFALFALLPRPWAQINGGQHVFQSFNLSPASRITALGGIQIAVRDDDPVFAAQNPAALNSSMSGALTFQHNFFLSDIQHGYAAYAHQLPRLGFSVHGGIQYLNYGEIPYADEFGNQSGNIKARETSLVLGASRPLSERLSIGLNMRLGTSTLDAWSASAVAADAGLIYADTARRLTVGAVLRNVGAQFNTFDQTRESLPVDLQIGVSKRLKYLPFRFGVVAHRLLRRDIYFDDPRLQTQNAGGFFDDPTARQGNKAVDNFFRHLVFNGEFLIGRNEALRLRFGYNHLRKRELSVRNYRSLAGFSGGIGLKFSRFRLDAGFATYHLAGGVFHIGIGSNLREFF